MTKNVQVLCRFRPISPDEEANEGEMTHEPFVFSSASPSKVHVYPLNGSSETSNLFMFDHVFPPSTSQASMFEYVKPLLNDCLKGYHSTLMAYGNTGSGKTHTIFGQNTTPLRGLLPRSAQYIFDSIYNETSNASYLMSCTCLEIYNENITDLLNPSQTKLRMRESVTHGVYVESLTKVSVASPGDMINAILKGEQNRHVSATALNKQSSRGHTVFTLYISKRLEDGSNLVGQLNFADLAGSERTNRSQVKNERFDETVKINVSLSALGKCIQMLTDNHSSFISYRESKLTYLLRDSLGGGAKTTLIVTCSPHYTNYDETVQTLRFAQRATRMQNRAVVHRQSSVPQLEALVSELRAEIVALKSQAIETAQPSRLERSESSAFAHNEEQIQRIIDLQTEVDEGVQTIEKLRSRISGLQSKAALSDTLQSELYKLHEQIANEEVSNLDQSEAWKHERLQLLDCLKQSLLAPSRVHLGIDSPIPYSNEAHVLRNIFRSVMSSEFYQSWQSVQTKDGSLSAFIQAILSESELVLDLPKEYVTRLHRSWSEYHPSDNNNLMRVADSVAKVLPETIETMTIDQHTQTDFPSLALDLSQKHGSSQMKDLQKRIHELEVDNFVLRTTQEQIFERLLSQQSEHNRHARVEHEIHSGTSQHMPWEGSMTSPNTSFGTKLFGTIRGSLRSLVGKKSPPLEIFSSNELLSPKSDKSKRIVHRGWLAIPSQPSIRVGSYREGVQTRVSNEKPVDIDDTPTAFWFILRTDALEWYDSPEETDPLGVLTLDRYTTLIDNVVSSDASPSAYDEQSFKLRTRYESHTLRAPNPIECDEWLRYIESVLTNFNSPLDELLASSALTPSSSPRITSSAISSSRGTISSGVTPRSEGSMPTSLQQIFNTETQPVLTTRRKSVSLDKTLHRGQSSSWHANEAPELYESYGAP